MSCLVDLARPSESGSLSAPATLEAQLETLRAALVSHLEAPDSAELRTRLAECRSEVARGLRALPKHAMKDAIVAQALEAARDLTQAGLNHFSGDTVGGAESTATVPARWQELMARMVLGSSWQWPAVPSFGEVPQWLWGDYAEWLFTAPRRFTHRGEAARYADHFLRHSEELARWVERNLGSPVVRAALDKYLSLVELPPLAVSESGLKRHAEAHGRILAAAGGARRTHARGTFNRAGRRLRVAFVGSHPSALPPSHGLLDASRFEVTAFAFEGAGQESAEGADIAVSAILALLQTDSGPRKCQPFPPTLVEQMAELSRAEPDVIVYSEELALSGGKLALLAAQRLAPLQLVMAPADVTSGLSTIDLFLTGEANAGVDLAGQFSERLALGSGSGHEFTELPEATVSRAEARAALQLPAQACVLVTVARLLEITPETMRRWAALLRALPDTALIVQLLQAADLPSGTIDAFGVEWDATLSAAGVAPGRGLILAGAIGSLGELQNVVMAGDVFLDSASFAEPDLLHVPLVCGLPVVTREGATLRTRVGAGLLRTLGVDDLVARDDAHFAAIVTTLVADESRRAALRERLRAAMSRQPLCCDALAAAETLGHVLIRAFDDMHALGARKFRQAAPLRFGNANGLSSAALLQLGNEALAQDEALEALERAREVMATAPAHAEARWLAGRALLALKRPPAAIDYLIAAVSVVDTGPVWFDLAVALQRNGQAKEALQALQTSLKHDGARADAWVLLFELAQPVGAEDLMRGALDALQACAPDDPRIAELTAKMNQVEQPD